ncbi:MAG: hypothetical protein FWD05_10265 [Oscillospiraceae bacterium]|nr:hypothetical protein [Oscillospiraceae bacterium]
MSINNIPIDLTDIPELTNKDFAKAKKNPYAKRIKENGYSITIHYSPEDVTAQIRGNVDSIHGMDMSDLDDDERRAFEKYLESNKEYLTESV